MFKIEFMCSHNKPISSLLSNIMIEQNKKEHSVIECILIELYKRKQSFEKQEKISLNDRTLNCGCSRTRCDSNVISSLICAILAEEGNLVTLIKNNDVDSFNTFRAIYRTYDKESINLNNRALFFPKTKGLLNIVSSSDNTTDITGDYIVYSTNSDFLLDIQEDKYPKTIILKFK